jgi:hypothetical protein
MNQKWMGIVAVVVILGAALLILRQTVWNPETQVKTGPTVQQIISRIENNPNMPPQAKAAAIAQIRMRSGSSAGVLKPPGADPAQK